ncbi:MAG: 2-dehydro-3-deoxygalactonokinase [Paracoccaceae bacterium]
MSVLPGLDWIAADWGTSNLRVWAMGAAGPLAEAESGDGMGSLDRAGFEPALLRLIGGWFGAGPVRVIACGMVGSRQGWAEAPYRAVPCAPVLPGRLARAPALDPRLDVRIVPGLKQESPADVMRGEETQIAGFLAARPGFDGVLCLPGTHSKWVRVSAGEAVSFQTFMTGELFGLIAERSVLRFTVSDEGWDDTAFAEAVGEALSRPERALSGLFALRAEGLLRGLAPGLARARLSGALIGIELAGSRPYWLGQRVAILGAEKLSRAYGAALAAQGVTAERSDAGAMTLAGLGAARAGLRERVT